MLLLCVFLLNSFVYAQMHLLKKLGVNRKKLR